MYKILIILYLTCFGLYLLFSRQPDYFDGEITVASIHFIKDSQAHKPEPYAFYRTDRKDYQVKAGYIFRSLKEGEQVPLIFEGSQPEKAAIYNWWGYWITAGEIIFSVILLLALYYIAVSVTSNPTPEALMEQINYKPVKKRKYES